MTTTYHAGERNIVARIIVDGRVVSPGDDRCDDCKRARPLKAIFRVIVNDVLYDDRTEVRHLCRVCTSEIEQTWMFVSKTKI